MTPNYTLPCFAVLLVLLSLYWYRFRKYHEAAIYSLFAGAFLLRWWMASIDPFLHDWDERFHALVASNMIDEPFRPMLLTHPNPGYDYKLWCCNNIWLHKPPLFLWQMALSMRAWGVELWSMRLPSVLMGALLVFPISRMGKLLGNSAAGYYAAVLYTFAYNQLEMISGNEGMDHNDVAFSFYVTLSLWAWFEFIHRGQSIRWAIWIGIFAGAAVLCKWLAGMLVYGVWGIDWLFQPSPPSRLQRLRGYLSSIGVALAVILPWQFYTWWKFPLEAAYEQGMNARHIFEVVERHEGDWSYYLEWFPIQYGTGLWILFGAGFVFLWRTATERRLSRGISASIVAVYAFFSLVAATKMPSFVYFIAPMVYLICGWGLAWLDQVLDPDRYTWKGSLAFLGMISVCCYLTLEPRRILSRHFQLTPAESAARHRKINNTRIYRQLDKWTPDGCTVYNCTGELEAMFFSHRVAYGMAPTRDEFKAKKDRGDCIAIFDDPDDLGVPGFIKEDSVGVIFLKEKLIREK